MTRKAGTKRSRWTKALSLLALGAGMAATASAPLQAAENGVGFYLLGTKGPLAGILPPPGVFFQNDTYFYSGSASASRSLPVAGTLIADVDATAYIDLMSGVWVLPSSVFGGRLAIMGTLPWGGQSIDASLSLPGPGFGAARDDTVFTIGDPVVGASLGWDHGNFHWTTGFLANVPIGNYQKGELANLAFHRWGLDLNAAVTWLDPATGWDLSAAAGITFNGENQATDYRTGTEFHLEAAISKAITKEFSAGVVGYYYDQISGDSGRGAKLGDFQGRVAALGVTAAYNFNVGNTPVSARAKVYREFATRNRLEGTAGFLTVSFPLHVTATAAN